MVEREENIMAGLDYDFSAGEEIEHDALRGAFMRLKPSMDSDDPDKRWDMMESLKMLAKTAEEHGGSPELREAVLSVMSQAMDDPDVKVSEKASREYGIVDHYHKGMESDQAALEM